MYFLKVWPSSFALGCFSHFTAALHIICWSKHQGLCGIFHDCLSTLIHSWQLPLQSCSAFSPPYKAFQKQQTDEPVCSLNVFIQLVFNTDLNPWKHPLIFLNLVIFTKQIHLLTVEYLFLFSFPGCFPHTTFLLFSVLAMASVNCSDDKAAAVANDLGFVVILVLV